MEIRKTYPKLSGKPYNKTIFKFHTRMTKEKIGSDVLIE